MHKSKAWIYRRVKKIERELSQDYPDLDPKLVHRTLQRAFLDAFQETDAYSMRVAAFGVLPNGYGVRVRTNFDDECRPAWNRVWSVDIDKWPIPFRANGKEYCFLVSVESPERLFLTLCQILASLLENARVGQERAGVLYMPGIKKATGINFLFDISELLPRWKADSAVASKAKQFDGERFLIAEDYELEMVDLPHEYLANWLTADTLESELLLAGLLGDLIRQVGQEQNTEQLRIALSQVGRKAVRSL